ncbi:MAG: hypothetical protein IJ578_02595 [Bacteroidales bacterium]|nr:hypothetical protein [Bacteroidales bacterium]
MKTILYELAAVLLIAAAATGCGNRKAARQAATEPEAQSVTETAQEVETCFTAIDKYLTDSIAANYSPSELSIPFHNYIAVDESNPDDIKVWGDFWVDNYVQAGDTLKTVSGGNHPGLMHVRQTGEHFEVTAFDPVLDGSEFLPSARRIFGEKYEDFAKAQADDKKREQIRGEVISAYVKRKNLPVHFYQDYGWPAVALK